ncbi:single-stranded DNA-binding protein [Bifidobacterium ruminantium]|mgnify:CR=1 FL=1|uniref:single-stranded DNA-binding protein n=1 Tax=Bifidobacterium ruminantium TaxID=78346 RepID=UPI00248FA6B6|nr:single-stranded DNA-binding protein [Bifidobacterium ruminantium]
MATINQIPMTIMGNIVKDLEPKRTAGGKTVITFRVAQTSVTERNGKWEDGETTFIRCVAYGALADHMIASGIRKGTRVIVTGRYAQRDWQTETGEKRSSFELNADDIGTSIRYATAQIAKAESAASQPAAQSQPQQARQQPPTSNDPWPNAVQDQFAEPQEPKF